MGRPSRLGCLTSADGLSDFLRRIPVRRAPAHPLYRGKRHKRRQRVGYEAKFTRPGANDPSLKRGCNDSCHSLNTQTNGIPLSCGGRFKNADSNLCLACSRSLCGPQRDPGIIQNGLQKLQSFGSECIHVSNSLFTAAVRTLSAGRTRAPLTLSCPASSHSCREAFGAPLLWPVF